MPFDFGNKYGMNKAEFEKSIEYFQNKINVIEEDDTISPSVKRWFLKRYNKRIQELEEAYQKLQETINEVKESKYVNEETATLNSLRGTSSKDNHAFRDFDSSEKRHKTGQFFRVLSMFTIVGLPFAIPGFIRSRQRHKLRKQENIELKEFVNTSNKPYSSKIGTTEAFSEEEMASLLSNPTELANVVALTSATSSVLNATQKKNLSKQLVGLKEYAQKNGYSIGTTLNAFETSTDNLIKKYTTATASAPTNLKEAHEKVEQLKAVKVEAEALLEADKDNDHLKSLVSNIDAAISSFTSAATGFVSTALSDIDAGLVAPTATDKASLEASNTGLDSTYNTPHAKLGVDLATAKTLANALGIDTSGFAPVTNKYSNLKSNNNSKLSEINRIEGYNNDLTTAETLLDELDSLTLTDVASISEAVGRLAVIENKLNAVESYATTLPAGDSSATKYRELNTRYLHKKQEVEEKQREIAISESDFDTYKTIIDDNLPKISKPYNPLIDDDLSILAAKKARLLDAKTALDTDDFKRKFASKMDVLQNEIQRATNNIAAIDTQIEFLKKEEHKKEAAAKLDPYKTLFNSNKYDPADGAITLEAKHDSLKDIIDAIDNDTFKAGIEDVVNPFVIEIKNQLTTIKHHLADYDKIKKLLDNAQNTIKKTCNSKRTDLPSVAEVTAIENIKSLSKYTSDAARWDLESQLNFILASAEEFLSHYTVSGSSKEDKKVERN